jgi:hypothetical protein
MRVFNYNSFADLSQVFDFRKGQAVPPQPKARVILYTTTAIRSRLAQSKFLDVNTFIPTVKPLFLTVSAKKGKPIVVTAAPVIAEAVPAPVVATPSPVEPTVAIAAAEEPKKARTTLKLKTKVELPSLTTLTRRSTAEDLAALFKAEMALMEKKAVAEPSKKLEDAFTKRRRHPLSSKPWSELFAEVEAPQQSRHHNFDLATAFKAEMKAFMAEQEKMGGETSTPAKFKSASEHKTVSPQPQQAPARHSPSMAA